MGCEQSRWYQELPVLTGKLSSVSVSTYPHVSSVYKNDTINPSTYQTLDKPGYFGVHAIGEVWAQILWVVSQRLIAVHGFSEELFPPTPLENGTVPEGDFYRPIVGKKAPVPKHGNSLLVQCVHPTYPCTATCTDSPFLFS